MRDWFNDVLDFHKKFGCHIGTTPAIPPVKVDEFRMRLVDEEYDELECAWEDSNLTETADAIADMIYVLIGMAIAYGIDLRKVWNAVHATNMMKDGGGKREDGKIIKPEGWKAPNIKGILENQESLCV
jgi:predicted HAD superfamily Cof-like phosphohydrolase